MPRRVYIDEEKFRALWLAGVPLRDIASELNVGADTLGGARRRLGLPARTAAARPPPRDAEPDDPTPAEIAARAAEVRARWDDETRERRRVGRSVESSTDTLPDSIFDVGPDEDYLE